MADHKKNCVPCLMAQICKLKIELAKCKKNETEAQSELAKLKQGHFVQL